MRTRSNRSNFASHDCVLPGSGRRMSASCQPPVSDAYDRSPFSTSAPTSPAISASSFALAGSMVMGTLHKFVAHRQHFQADTRAVSCLGIARSHNAPERPNRTCEQCGEPLHNCAAQRRFCTACQAERAHSRAQQRLERERCRQNTQTSYGLSYHPWALGANQHEVGGLAGRPGYFGRGLWSRPCLRGAGPAPWPSAGQTETHGSGSITGKHGSCRGPLCSLHTLVVVALGRPVVSPCSGASAIAPQG